MKKNFFIFFLFHLLEFVYVANHGMVYHQQRKIFPVTTAHTLHSSTTVSGFLIRPYSLG